MKNLSEETKKRIVLNKENGSSNREIAKKLNVSHTTVSNVLKEKNIKIISEKKGRPKCLSKRQERKLVKQFQVANCLNSTDGVGFIKEVTGKDVSNQLVRNVLKKNGITAHKRIKAPEISTKNLKCRKKFYETHKGKTFDSFQNVIFFDESTFPVKASSGGLWYYRGSQNKIPSKAVIRTTKFGNGKLMIFGFITSSGNFKVYKIDGTMNSKKYVSLLEENILDDIVDCGFNLSDVVFMQDNASCHKSKSTMKWFEDHNLNLLEWPPQSPDLNPIENVWNYLETKVRMRQNEIENADDLWKIILEESRKISASFIKKLYKSIPKRINLLK